MKNVIVTFFMSLIVGMTYLFILIITVLIALVVCCCVLLKGCVSSSPNPEKAVPEISVSAPAESGVKTRSQQLQDDIRKLDDGVNRLKKGREKIDALLTRRTKEADDQRVQFQAALYRCGDNSRSEKLIDEFQSGKLSASNENNPAISEAFKLWQTWQAVEMDRVFYQRKRDDLHRKIVDIENKLGELTRLKDKMEIQETDYNQESIDQLIAETEANAGETSQLVPGDLVDMEKAQSEMNSALRKTKQR